jgi:Transposase DDE domain
LDAAGFVKLLVWGWFAQPKASLNQLATFGSQLGQTLTAQAIDERLKASAVLLLMQVLEGVLHKRQFKGVYITDSTQFSLPAALNFLFAGQGSGSQVKVQLCLEYLSGCVSGLELEAGRTPDQKCLLPIEHGQAGSLHLFDLGYFKQDHLELLSQQQAFYVTRYQSQTAIYDNQTGERINVLKCLDATAIQETEINVTLGARVHTPLRLIAHRLPPKHAAARRRKVKRKAHKDGGKTCSATYLSLQNWDLYLTNLPADWTNQEIQNLYKLRWQIELIFRMWKSQLRLAHFGQWRVERVLCQLYAHLIGCVLAHALTANWRCRKNIEYSPVKLLQLLHQYFLTIWYETIAHFTFYLEDAFKRFARKDKRKKAPSTFFAFMD